MMKDILSQQSSSPGMLNAAPSVVSEPTQILPTVVRRSPSRHLEGDQNTPLSLVCDLSVVIPTRNERDNIEPLLRVLKSALDGIRVEVLFVDDSDDDTPRVVREAARTFGSSSFHVHIEHRAKGPARAGGLATAVDLGMSLAQAKYVAVLDADLQHPPEQLRVFYEQAVLQDVDMVLASRYIKGGGYQGLDGFSRVFYSVGLKWTAKICFPEHLMRVSDPLGGFFLLRRSLLTNVTLRPIGYKILLEILIRCPWRSLVEVPYHFQARANGQSKASMKQGVQVLQHIWRLVKEVPDAARVWKISALLLINAIVVLMLLLLYPYITSYWSAGSPLAFVLLAGLDFWLVNRFIFPPRFRVADAVQSSTGHPEVAKSALPSSSVSAVELAQTVKTSASHIPDTPTTQMQTVKLGIDVPVEQVQTARLSADMPVEAVQTARMPSTPVPNTPIDVLHTVKRPTLPLHLTHARRVVRNTLPVTEVEQEHTVHMPNLPSRVLFKDKMLLRIAFVAAVGAVAWIIFTLPGALVILAAFFLGFSIITRKNVDQHQLITMLLGVTVGISCIDYVSWRFAVTNWGGWWIAVPLLFAETLGAVHTLGFQFTLWPWPKPYFRWREDPTHHPIFIFVPTVNEGTAILGPTLKGALAARDAYLETYPHGQVTIVVCNDGFVANAPDWRETEQLCQQLGVVCITRTKKGGAKAGNIEHARQMLRATDNALLVIFDADQVAKPDFLLKTIPAFGDPHIGWVQTGQYYRNLENPVARWADDQQAMFYNLICPGKAALNAAFICGTNVVIRARALDQIGGFPQDSVTEDFSASIELHPYWRSLYLSDVLATGLGPMDVASYLKQQRRWAIGTLGVLRTHWRKIFLPSRNGPGLSFPQRIQYVLACTHYLCGLRDLIYLLAPILFIFTGIPAVRGSTLPVFLWHFLPYWISSLAALWYAGRGITGLRGIIIGFGCFPVLIESLLSVILQRKVGFAVTSKQRGTTLPWNYISIYLAFMLVGVFCIFLTTRARPDQQASTFISAMWIVYSLLLLGSFMVLNIKDFRVQSASKQEEEDRSGEAWKKWDYPSRLKQREPGLRPLWNLLLSLALACVVFTVGIFHFNVSQPTAFAMGPEMSDQPLLGVSVPLQLLSSRPGEMEQQLGGHFSIIGRTQDVHDLFNRSWADQLAANNQRPWITLEFGTLQDGGKPPLDASLTAISNGVNDALLQRWAQSVRDYGKPIYLTFLLHVDRNWSLSSAVANGGIPQDSARAWLHIRSVFKQAGASNVAWVWAPADPVHDQPYAPPPSQIDAVLVSWISYPNTQWVDPQQALNNLVARYPNKPIIVEASANGPAAQKAAWLANVGDAVDATPDVYALIYHEGAPGANASVAEDTRWSAMSDPSSESTMRQIIVTLSKKHRSASAAVHQNHSDNANQGQGNTGNQGQGNANNQGQGNAGNQGQGNANNQDHSHDSSQQGASQGPQKGRDK